MRTVDGCIRKRVLRADTAPRVSGKEEAAQPKELPAMQHDASAQGNFKPRTFQDDAARAPMTYRPADGGRPLLEIPGFVVGARGRRA